MGAVSQRELVIERGEGPWVFDSDGNRYLDGTASLWYANLGHGRTEIADAVAAQMKRIEAYHTFADVGNRPAGELCEALAARAPFENAKIFLTSGGGDSIEVAAKLARRHFVLHNQPERVHLISRAQGYHGTHGFGTSLGGIEANTSNWGPLVSQISTVEFDSLPALEAEIRRVGHNKVAAFFCEPVIGAAGETDPRPLLGCCSPAHTRRPDPRIQSPPTATELTTHDTRRPLHAPSARLWAAPAPRTAAARCRGSAGRPSEPRAGAQRGA
jgi:putrescine aminotransferase